MDERNYPYALDILIENHYAYVDKVTPDEESTGEPDEENGDRLEWVDEFDFEKLFFNDIMEK